MRGIGTGTTEAVPFALIQLCTLTGSDTMEGVENTVVQALDAMCYTVPLECLVVHGLISLEQGRGTLWRSHALHASDEHNPA